MQRPTARQSWAIALLIVILALAATPRLMRPTSPVPDVPFSDFLLDVENDRVGALVVKPNALEVTRRSGDRALVTVPSGYIGDNPALLSGLAKKGVRIDVSGRPGSSTALEFLWLILTAAFVGAFGFAIYRVSTGRALVPNAGGHRADTSSVCVTFEDVAGVDEAKEEVREVVDFLRNPGRFGAVGGRIPKGILLVGPPGMGKTLLARSIAGEAKVPFLYASGSDFVEMYAGIGASRIRRLFKDARRHPACIIFIDEVDAVGRSRGGNSLTHEEREQTLNQLLVELDGFAPNQGIVVIAATNRADILDGALLRPGRFDRQVVVGAPDVNGREQILKLHARKLALASGIDLRAIARGTPGFSGADLANLLNEAALLATRADRSAITAADLEGARDKVMMGVERRSLTMSEHERRVCAYHEAGHAAVAVALPDADPLHKVTIVPRGRALGLTMQLPEGDRHMHSREFLEAQIAVLMAGRAAEEIFLGQATSGAANDIERATEMARRMVCEFGMSPMGPLAFRAAGDNSKGAGLSEATAMAVDDEIRRLVMRGDETAREILNTSRGGVEKLANALLLEESVDAAAVHHLLASAAS
jgi:cell division protease FtsH